MSYSYFMIVAVTHLDDRLVDPNHVFERGNRFLEPFTNSPHVGHRFEVVILAERSLRHRWKPMPSLPYLDRSPGV